LIGRRRVTSDVVPAHKIQVRPGEPIYTSGGPIGRLRGLSVAGDGSLTHVVVAEGVLLGSKLVAIPIKEVTTLEGGIRSNLTVKQIKDLPVIDPQRPMH
jgi:hypothetical protein